MTTLATKPSTPRLSEAARHVVIPKGIVTTAWPRVVAQCEDMGVTFDPWQHGIGSVALGKRANGKYAASVGGVVLSIPRQVGKTFLVGMIVIALCVIFPGMTVLWTAHRTRTATKTFHSLKAMTQRKRVAPHMLDPRLSNGEQELRFRNGSVVMFGAREQGFGRGFDEVDIEVFDEAQILSEKALEDIVPAANQSRQQSGALLFFMGTPPRPADPGDEFTNRRKKALSGQSDSMVYVEFSADPQADPDDRSQWAKANPSFPRRTPVESMERMRENLTDVTSFMREGLGVWDDAEAIKALPKWSDALDSASRIESRHQFAIDVAPGQEWSSIAVAGVRSDGGFHVEVTSRAGVVDHRPGTDWMIPRLRELRQSFPSFSVWIAAGSVAEAMVPDIKDAGITVETVKAGDVTAACGLLYRFVENGNVHHVGQPQLTGAVTGAVPVNVADGAMKWARRKSTTDITPLYAATVALWAAQSSGRSKYEDQDMVTV